MRVFVTGASGFIGSAVVSELVSAGHDVLGLARSDASAQAVEGAGAQVHRGDLENLESLRAGAESADGVIHLAFNHDFTAYTVPQRPTGAPSTHSARCSWDPIGPSSWRRAAGFSHGPHYDRGHTRPGFSARLGATRRLIHLAQRTGLGSAAAASVHGEGDHGFVPRLIDIARVEGVAAYPGDGSNRWPAVHRFDAARLFRLALESAPAGARLHAIGDEGIPVRDIAGAIGRHLGLPVTAIAPETAFDHFGWLGGFFSLDVPPRAPSLASCWGGGRPTLDSATIWSRATTSTTAPPDHATF